MNDQTSSYFIGWDVGAWNCEKNSKSRDAIIILDSSLSIVGEPKRGNLRDAICGASDARDWVTSLFDFCKAGSYDISSQVVIAMDTPLGFSDEFVNLLANRKAAKSISKGQSKTNSYLFRETERRLFKKDETPLSAVTHMIGNQATKGMHALAQFDLTVQSCGVWTDKDFLRAIETYPAACRDVEEVETLRQEFQNENKQVKIRWDDDEKDNDEKDALTCALVAHLFATRPHLFEAPDNTVSENEGWIWVPDVMP